MPAHDLALIGFGNVGRALVRLLVRKQGELRERYAIEWRVTAIATSRHGAALDPAGLDALRAVEVAESGGNLGALSSTPAPASVLDLIRASRAQVLFENTPVNALTGEPAIAHLRAALECGMHAITANKGPVVHGYAELNELARRKGRHFFHESAVMDGAPIFSLFRCGMPAAQLRGFRGVLNSTTNLILGLMEEGKSFDEAVRHAQAIGIAETDPSADIDGWDAAIKVSALATSLMGVPLKPQEVNPLGIRGLSGEEVRAARAAGTPYKLVCSATRTDGGVRGSVRPEKVPLADPLAGVRGTSSIVQFETDVLGRLTVQEDDPGPHTTAYGLLADLVTIVKGEGKKA